MSDRFITLLVHAEAKVGKTWLGDTTPAPRLVVDAEGGIRFTPSRKTWWDPIQDPPPEPGDWETCVVTAGSIDVLNATYQWLNRGEHPFRSVTLDSVMELQKRAKSTLSVGGDMEQQDWGRLLAAMEDTTRNFRDLTLNPRKPMEAVVYTCGSRERDGLLRPLLQGAILYELPYFVDCVGYLYPYLDDQGARHRVLNIEPGPLAVAGNRFGGRLPGQLLDPTVEQMLDALYREGD